MTPTDRSYLDLVDRARAGDAEAFCALLQHHDPALRRLAYRIVGSRGLMDDVLQEAYIKAFAAIRRFEQRDPASLERWLHRVVYTCAIDELRRDRGRDCAELVEPRSSSLAAGTPSSSELVLLRIAIATALQDLPPRHRALITLIDESGFDYHEAAEILDISRGTVASGLSRARESLKSALRGWEVRGG